MPRNASRGASLVPEPSVPAVAQRPPLRVPSVLAQLAQVVGDLGRELDEAARRRRVGEARVDPQVLEHLDEV